MNVYFEKGDPHQGVRVPEKKKGGTGVSPIEFTVTRARDKHCGIFDENDNARKTTFPKTTIPQNSREGNRMKTVRMWEKKESGFVNAGF